MEDEPFLKASFGSQHPVCTVIRSVDYKYYDLNGKEVETPKCGKCRIDKSFLISRDIWMCLECFEWCKVDLHKEKK